MTTNALSDFRTSPVMLCVYTYALDDDSTHLTHCRINLPRQVRRSGCSRDVFLHWKDRWGYHCERGRVSDSREEDFSTVCKTPAIKLRIQGGIKK